MTFRQAQGEKLRVEGLELLCKLRKRTLKLIFFVFRMQFDVFFKTHAFHKFGRINKLINHIGPAFVTSAIIKYFIAERFAKMDADVLFIGPEHFVGQKQHFYIGFNSQTLAQTGKIVKKPGVFTFNKCWHHLALMINGLLYNALFPA